MTETVTVSGVDAIAETTPAMTALERKRSERIEVEAVKEAELEASIPKPVGYRVLIALPNVEDTFGESGLLKAESTRREEYILSTVGSVLDMGEQAYSDKERFPTGPWCKVGDHVMFRANTGTRFKVGNQEFRLMNDDSIEAVVDDPRAVSRA
uniref:Co-chaperonin GroES n=1 Tax=uncultured virus TaxID=340016 RepID=A0A221S4D1_9VIRU|nr:co-chaperonin GroES [uncultured virus]